MPRTTRAQSVSDVETAATRRGAAAVSLGGGGSSSVAEVQRDR
jgi:hypothetical protein